MNRLLHFRMLRAACVVLLAGAGMLLFYMTVGAQLPPMKPSVGFKDSSKTTNEKVGFITLEVVLSNAYTETVTVQYATGKTGDTATAGSDYTAASGTLTFAVDETSQTIVIEIIDDGTGESLEGFTVTLSNATNVVGISPSELTVSIEDGAGSSPAFVAFEFESWSVNESDGTATITVLMTGSPTDDVSVDFRTENGTAIAGTDYTSTSGTRTWAKSDAGQTRSFTVSITDNSTPQDSRYLTLVLSNSVNASLISPAIAWLDILDDDDDICP